MRESHAQCVRLGMSVIDILCINGSHFYAINMWARVGVSCL